MAFQRVSVNTKQNGTAAEPVPTAGVQNDAASEASHTEKFRMRVVSPQATNQDSLGSSSHEESVMSSNEVSKKIMMIAFGVVLVLGLGTGLAGAFMTRSSSTVAVPKEDQKTAAQVQDAVRVGAVFGVPDENTFRDDTEGVLIKGGIEGEGSHTLLRPGGVSQNVYLTSSVVDLDQFENQRIRIWGETFKGQKAGWLMDVGRVEIKELNADMPEWYVGEEE